MPQRRMMHFDQRSRYAISPQMLVRVAGLASLLGTSVACSSDLDFDSGASHSGTLAQERSRSASGDVSTWTSWHMPLSVCFSQPALGMPGHMSPVTFLQRATSYFDVLVSTWGRVPGVSFDSSCTPSERLNILLRDDVPDHDSSHCGIPSGCVIYGVNNGVFVHETGHGLGLSHELQRVDAQLCPEEQFALDTWHRCEAADAAGQPCTAADYNAIFYPNPPVSSPTYLTNEDRSFLQWSLDNNEPDPSYKLLTIYDRQSVMNYCAGSPADPDFGREPGDFMPTALDLLGVEMLYPLSSGTPLGCKQGCFKTSTGVVARGDAVVTSDWTARGALNVPISLTTAPGGTTIPASALPSGTASVNYYYWDPRGVRRSGTAISQKSNSMHAALVSSTTVL